MPPDRLDDQRHKEAQMRSNPVRDAIMTLIEDRPEVEARAFNWLPNPDLSAG